MSKHVYCTVCKTNNSSENVQVCEHCNKHFHEHSCRSNSHPIDKAYCMDCGFWYRYNARDSSLESDKCIVC